MGTHPDPRVWNMFERREEGDIWCAVPADTAVPRFLFSGDWNYSGQHPERRTLPGFQRAVAHQSVRMNGFYLFQVLRTAGSSRRGTGFPRREPPSNKPHLTD